MGPLFLLLAVVLTGCSGQEDIKPICPLKEDIKPCTCNVGKDGKPWVTCDGIDSVDKLRTALKGLVGYQLSIFYLEKSNIGVLPADIFRQIEIQSLSILFTNLTDLSEGLNRPPFLGLERSLEDIEIKECFLNEEAPLTRLSLSHLKKLTFLQVESNVIPTIGNDWFESGPYGMKELHFLDSYTKKIGSHAFASLKNLRQISVTGGSVSKITRDMFPSPALSLESIDLSDNALSSLPGDLFTSMPSLTEVFLDNNALKGIDEIVWAPVWSQLTHVFFYGNIIACDNDVRWMYKYRLPEVLHGYCVSPESMRGKDMSKVTLEDFKEKRTAR